MSKKAYSRKAPSKNTKEGFLILCEGKNTERIYFESFKLVTATIKVIPIPDKGGNALRFVEEALKIIKQTTKTYDNYWLVFDKDENTDENFNKAIQLANKEPIAKNTPLNLAYSNQAFELWFILHFISFHNELHRKLYKEKLTKLLGFEYEKDEATCRKVLPVIYPKIQNALKNARDGYNKIGNHTSPAKEESSTTVFMLVEKILSFL